MTELDDELADFGGVADSAVVALTVAAHAAVIALLDRSARALPDRSFARLAAEVVVSRLARRGDARLAASFAAALADLGTSRFEPVLQAAADAVARRMQGVPPRHLAAALRGHSAPQLMSRSDDALGGAEVEALASHLADGAEVTVGGGLVGPLEPDADQEIVEVEVDRLPDPRLPSVLSLLALRRHGTPDAVGRAALILCRHVGASEVRLWREGRHAQGTLHLEGRSARLRVVVRERRLELTPIAPDECADARRLAADEWSAVQREVQRDALLAELVADLYGHAGFGGSAETLRSLLDLAPLIHRHESIARRMVAAAPARIRDATEEIVIPLRAALLAADEE